MRTIEIYYDEQDSSCAGWSWRDTAGPDEPSLGSGPIDLPASQRWCDAIADGQTMDDGAIRAELALLGIDPGSIIFVDRQGQRIGNPWPDVPEWRAYGGDAEMGQTWFPADDAIFN